MKLTSPRTVVPYQIEQSFPTSTSPIKAAFSATKTRSPSLGFFPSYALTIIRRGRLAQGLWTILLTNVR